VSAWLDRVLGWLKWPVALAGVLLLPGLAVALARVVEVIAGDPAPSYPFLAGLGGYLLVHLLVLRRRTLGTFLVTFEHEITHAIFAWLTFHRVVGFRASLRGGGHVRYLGRGNWLISIAPYFVPTLSLLALAVIYFLPERHLAIGSAALGATVSYHLVSTWAETHRNQTDLREVGFLFSALFLIPANAFVLIVVLAAACGLSPVDALSEVPDTTLDLIRGMRS
jgi:hypothetical protein